VPRVLSSDRASCGAARWAISRATSANADDQAERGDQWCAHWPHLRSRQGSRALVCRVAHSHGRGSGRRLAHRPARTPPCRPAFGESACLLAAARRLFAGDGWRRRSDAPGGARRLAAQLDRIGFLRCGCAPKLGLIPTFGRGGWCREANAGVPADGEVDAAVGERSPRSGSGAGIDAAAHFSWRYPGAVCRAWR
jgi:hypothetical protein